MEEPSLGLLTGIKVLDLSRVLAGPYITMCLGDLGADVIKIENPGTGDETRGWGPPFAGKDSAYFLAINRNKRSVTVNLKRKEGRDIVYALVKEADVVIENFKAQTRTKLGMDYDTLTRYNPSLIMLSISAFGDKGPYKDRPGYDLLAQAMGGLMSLTGEEGGPPVKAGFPVADLATGVFGLSGVLSALFHRAQTGEGLHVNTSLYESQLAFHINWAMNYFLTGVVPHRMGSQHPNLAPYQAFSSSDGYFVVACGNDELFRKLCQVIGEEDLSVDERFTTNAQRVIHRTELAQELNRVFSSRTTQDWCRDLDRAGVPSGPIATLEDIYHDPHTEALGIVQTVEHPEAGPLPQIGFPVPFSQDEAVIHRAPPLLGADTDDVLRTLGYRPHEIENLRKSGVL